jgi:hypothetical protein
MVDPKIGPDTPPVRPKVDSPVTPGKEPDPVEPKPPGQPDPVTPPRDNVRPEAPAPTPKDPLGDVFRDPSAPDPNESPEVAARRKRAQAAISLWERNVGPIDETPAVKRALLDLVEGTEDIKDSEGNSFWDTLSKETGDATSFADWVGNAGGGESWKLPDFSLGWGGSKTDVGPGGGSSSSGDSWWSRRSSSSSSSGSGSGTGGFDLGIPGLEGSWLSLVLLGVVLVGGLLLWKYLYFRDAKAGVVFDLGGLGPWPVDPRTISTREELVKAFEYLSVLICGPAARMWTHGTIASALADLATTHSEAAMILARLYELARYAPLDEPLTADEIEEARRLVCRLAGVSYA